MNSTNLKVNRAVNITESKMYDIEDSEDILTHEIMEAVENWKYKTVKSRNKDYMTMTVFEFSKRFHLYKTSVSHVLLILIHMLYFDQTILRLTSCLTSGSEQVSEVYDELQNIQLRLK